MYEDKTGKPMGVKTSIKNIFKLRFKLLHKVDN